MLRDLDENVGMIIEEIKAQGLDESTFVFFFSDHGAVYMNPNERPFRGKKQRFYEGGHRIPAVAWMPGSLDNESSGNK